MPRAGGRSWLRQESGAEPKKVHANVPKLGTSLLRLVQRPHSWGLPVPAQGFLYLPGREHCWKEDSRVQAKCELHGLEQIGGLTGWELSGSRAKPDWTEQLSGLCPAHNGAVFLSPATGHRPSRHQHAGTSRGPNLVQRIKDAHKVTKRKR